MWHTHAPIKKQRTMCSICTHADGRDAAYTRHMQMMSQAIMLKKIRPCQRIIVRRDMCKETPPPWRKRLQGPL